MMGQAILNDMMKEKVAATDHHDGASHSQRHKEREGSRDRPGDAAEGGDGVVAQGTGVLRS